MIDFELRSPAIEGINGRVLRAMADIVTENGFELVGSVGSTAVRGCLYVQPAPPDGDFEKGFNTVLSFFYEFCPEDTQALFEPQDEFRIYFFSPGNAPRRLNQTGRGRDVCLKEFNCKLSSGTITDEMLLWLKTYLGEVSSTSSRLA